VPIAYIDESGNKDIDVPKEGATNHYVVGSVVVDVDRNAELEAAAESIAKRFFNGGPIKSSKVGDDDARRIEVLRAFADVPGVLYALPIDKRRIDRDTGLAYKRSFYKYVFRLAAGELLRTIKELEVVVDSQGDEEFQRGVVEYMNRRYAGELFAQKHVRFAPSKESRGVQLADFVAGTVLKSFEREVAGLVEPIRHRLICSGPWPSADAFPHHLERSLEAEDREADLRIVRMVDQRTRAFLQGPKDDKDEFAQAQLACVRKLHSRFLFDPYAYTPRAALMRHLEQQLPDVVRTVRMFQTRVIAPARDGGVPIVASRRHGYKLPISLSEVLRHADQQSEKIVPMVRRLRSLRDALHLATGGDVDLFLHEGLGYLRTFGLPDSE
jgi:hypothetical protein